MAYSYETSSVKTINGEVSGLADVVARQAIANLPTLSAGEGIQIVNEDGKNRIDLGLSAGSNMSFVYDQETNTIRLDAEGGNYSGVSPIVVNNTTNQISADTWSFSAGNGLKFTDDNVNKVTKLEVEGETLSAGPGINMFESGGYVVISANGGGSTFPITGINGTTGFTANMDCSSMMLTTGASPAGGYVKQTTRGVQYEAYPATDVSASWYNIINGANNSSNYYCVKLNSTNTAASLEDYSAYDRVTVIHAEDYGPDYLLHWDGKTKVFPSGLYCEMAKVKDDQNEDKWTFLNSGWTFDFWWDYD